MLWPAVLLLAVGCTHAQLTAQTSVAPDLRECFMNSTLVDRNNLPPATMAVLIDIIQKIEDNPSVNMNLRQMAVVLLHTYRQDGIQYHQPETQLSSTAATVLHYSASFHSFYRHRLLLTKLIPNNLQVLGNETLPATLKCALHYMLSVTLDGRQRSDESSCSQLSQYRARRVQRDLLRQRKYNPKDDVEFTDYNHGETKSQRQMNSQCPILGGVIQSSWGALSAGNLIAGIAAGAEAQQVALTEILKGGVLNTEYSNLQQYVTTLYPATLSGDLAEAALIQGSDGGASISIGAAGGWNSTEARKFYMIQSLTNLEMTDPEIRADIDGFLLGATVASSLSTYSSLKLSQLLDMYYSDRNGVFNSQLRACNRRELAQQYINVNTLAAETYAFSVALDTHIPLRGTITGGLENLVTNAVTNFQNYATNNLNDVTCETTVTSAHDYRLRTNLYIVLDASWPYDTIYPAISHILDRIEIGKFGSSATILSAFDGSIVINKTFSPADFHTAYTLTKHQSMFVGVNLLNVYSNVHTLMLDELDSEKNHNYVGGNSTVLLFLINSGNLQINDQVLEQARILNDTAPDLRVLYATSGNQENNLWNLVRDMHNDIMTITLSSNGLYAANNLQHLINRIGQVNRRVISSACGSLWNSGTSSGTKQFDDFVEPGYVNFYSVAPNYFFHNNDNRKIRVTRSSGGTGSLVICHSRQVTQPRQNSTMNVDDNSVTCQTLASNGNVEVSLQNACDGYWTINTCPNLYFSVQSVVDGVNSLTAVCSDLHSCRFPYNIRYQVQIEEFGCFSSGPSNVASFIMVLLTSVFVFIGRI